jgi:hypothetical protein
MLLAESGAYSAAIDNFQRAGESVAAQVNLADAYAHIGRVDDADGVLKRIDRERVHDSLKLECISAAALVATKRGDIKAVNALIDEARSLNLLDLYFQRSRDQLCISLLEFATGKQNAARTAAEKKVRGILGWIRYVSQFLEIKPNVMGLGVNVNQLLEELPAKK